MTDYFSYNNGAGVVPPNAFRISPSQLSRFFDSTNEWYREFLLGESFFTGSTATELGTCVHAAAQMYAIDRIVHHDQIVNYISTLPPDIDKSHILSQYPTMVDTLIAHDLQYNIPHLTEQFYWHEILPGIGVGGSLDAIKFSGDPSNPSTLTIRGNRIRDYKTTSSKTLPTKFSRAYYFQQLAYAWLCKQQGITIEFLDLVFVSTSELNRISETTGKPLKDYPSQVSVVTHQVTADDLNLIDGVLNLVAHSVQLWQTQPKLRYALAQDWRLHIPEKPIPKLFKD